MTSFKSLFSLSSLRARLLLLALFAVLPALVLTFIADLEMRRLREAQARENTLRLTRLAAGDLIQVIEGTRQLLVGLVQLSEVRQTDPAQCNTLFTDLLNQYPYYINLGVVEADGRLFCGARPTATFSINRDSLRDLFKTPNFSIGGYQIDPATGEGTILFGYPVSNRLSTARAVVFAALNLSWFDSLETEAQLPERAVLVVMDQQGTILARYPHPQKWSGKSVRDTVLAQAILSGEDEGVAEVSGLDGVRRLYAFTVIRDTSKVAMVVSIGIAKEAAFRAADQIFIRNLAGLALVGMLTLVAAWLIGNAFIVRRVDVLVRATKQLAEGNLNTRLGPPYEQDEFGQLAQSFDSMAESLEQHSTQLGTSREQLRDLAAHLESVREEERTRIAREIHDELGQALTGLKMDLSWMDRRISETEEETRKALLSEKLKSSIKLVDTTIQSVRKIATELRPGVLDDLGLTAAIEWQALEFQERTGIRCELELPEEDLLLDQDRSSAIFRIFQELLTNIARHADATCATISLIKRTSRITLEVRDNGRGIEEEEISHAKSFGILGMRERALLLGGEFHIAGAPGEGTKVILDIPLDVAKSATS